MNNKEENKAKQTKSTKGFYTLIGEEAISSFNNEVKKNNKVIINTGQAVNVFKEKETLINLIVSKPALKKAAIAIVAVKVPNDCIVNPNHKTFGIKAGKKIHVVKTQLIEEVFEETRKLTAVTA